MKNNKGFTLIEILAAVTILAIISTISVVAVTRYVEKTKVKSYETMYKVFVMQLITILLMKG